MYSYLSEKIYQQRKLLFILFLLTNLISLIALPKFQLENNFISFFSDDFEPYKDYLLLSDEYPISDSVVLVLSIDKKQHLVSLIENLKLLEQELTQLDHFKHTKSILDIPVLNPGNEDFSTDYPFAQINSDTTPSSRVNQNKKAAVYLKAWEKFQNDPRAKHLFVAENGLATSMVISFNLPNQQRQIATSRINTQIREILNRHKKLYTDVQYSVIGPLVVQDQINKGFKKDLVTLGLPILMLGFILIWWSNRSVWGLVAGGASIISALVFTAALATLFGFQFNQTSILAFVLAFIIGLADTIHLSTTMFSHMQKGATQKEALQRSITHNLRPITLTTLTTAVGFSCLYFCDSPPFQILGLTATIGVLAAYFSTLCCLPYLLSVKELEARGGNTLLIAQFKRLNVIRENHRTAILLVFSVLSLFSLYGLGKNTLDNNELDYFPADSQIQRNVAEITKHFPGYNRLQLVIRPLNSKDITDIDFLKKVENVETWLYQQAHVVHTQSYLQLLRYLNQAFHNGDPQYYEIPRSNLLSQDLMFLLEFSSTEKFNSRGLMSPNKDSLKLDIYVQAINNRDLIELANNIEKKLAEQFEGNQFSLSGRPLVFAHLGQSVIKNMLWGSLFALLGVTALTFIGLRSIKLGLLSILPNILPGILIFGLWGLLVGKIDIAAAVTFTLCLGIIVDDTIHILSGYQQHRDKGMGPQDAITLAIEQSGPSLLMTTLVIGLGFSILSFSHLGPNATIGYMSAPIIFSALILDFLLLPLLLPNKPAVN